MATTILVTGSTGTIGSQVVKALAGKADVKVRAAVRGSEKARPSGPNVTAVDFDYADAGSIRAALEGVDAAFLLTPLVEDPVTLGKAFVDAAKKAGVKRIVKLSALGCDMEPGITLGRQHRAVEELVEASGIAWTFLRPNNFMQNFVNYYPPQKDGAIYLPWGDGACSFVDARDIGAVAAEVLTKDGHAGKAYVPTGPSAITIADAAKTIGEVTGRSIRYVDVPEEAAKKAMLDMGMPAWAVDGMMELHAIDKAGYAAAVTDDVKKVTGRAPRSFREFATDHANAWK